MMERQPHDPYMDLVHAYMADLGMFPTGFRANDDDDVLDAVFQFPEHAVSEDEWPDGVFLSWTSSDGWTLTDRGNRTSYPLGVDPYSPPDVVAALTRARLAGRPDLAITRTENWDLCEMTSAAVDAWARAERPVRPAETPTATPD
ncbi:hypothetical protein ABZT51_51385 [Streptomyces sp. NPDC005373]|uniref:hypothetical protein n=1 Tax=Streptomyces sp. NPDC005373 TaxID=3156879 RepID=UPI0033AB2F49